MHTIIQSIESQIERLQQVKEILQEGSISTLVSYFEHKYQEDESLESITEQVHDSLHGQINRILQPFTCHLVSKRELQSEFAYDVKSQAFGTIGEFSIEAAPNEEEKLALYFFVNTGWLSNIVSGKPISDIHYYINHLEKLEEALKPFGILVEFR